MVVLGDAKFINRFYSVHKLNASNKLAKVNNHES